MYDYETFKDLGDHKTLGRLLEDLARLLENILVFNTFEHFGLWKTMVCKVWKTLENL